MINEIVLRRGTSEGKDRYSDANVGLPGGMMSENAPGLGIRFILELFCAPEDCGASLGLWL